MATGNSNDTMVHASAHIASVCAVFLRALLVQTEADMTIVKPVCPMLRV